MYYIESKATWNDRFDFSMITDTQREGLLKKSRIPFVRGIVIVLFASYKRAFMIDIRSIVKSIETGNKSVNVNRLNKSNVKMSEIDTIKNNRKTYIDYKIEKIKEQKNKTKYQITFDLEKSRELWELRNLNEIDRQKIHGLY